MLQRLGIVVTAEYLPVTDVIKDTPRHLCRGSHTPPIPRSAGHQSACQPHVLRREIKRIILY